jgi:hypothetical protein
MSEIEKVNYRAIAYLTALGFLMALGMLVLLLGSGDTDLVLDNPQDIDDMNDTIRDNKNQVLLLITLDTFFIAGYTGLFIGLFLILKEHLDVLAKIGLMFGLATSMGDVLENAIQYALVFGVHENWTPDASIYVFFWVIAYFIDISSYVAGLIFGFGLISDPDLPKNLRTLGFLLLLYAGIGFFAFFSSLFGLLRSFFFVIGILYATVVFFRTS